MRTSLALLAILFATAVSAAEPETKILLCFTQPDHPYATHMYEFECRLLAKCLEQTAGVKTVMVKDWPEDEDTLTGVNSIVYYSRPAGDIVLAPPRRDKFRQLMKQGVGLVCVHWATGSSEANAPHWLEALGGWFKRPPCGLKTTTSTLKQAAQDHPVCRGWKEYSLRDEFYLNLRFHEKTLPVLKVRVDDKDQTVAWAIERPDSKGGRSFGTTLGHFHDNFGREPFRRAIVNGILWTAHVDVPKEGAPVKLSEEDLKLPPRRKR